MKKIITTMLCTCFVFAVMAQDTEMESTKENGKQRSDSKKGFRLDNMFSGGGIQLSFAGSTFVGGASPVLGYSINKWLDAGIVANFTYSSDRHVTYLDPSTGLYYTSDDKLRQTTYGPGAFVKFYPLNFLFIQAQGELNFVSQKLIFDNGAPSERIKTSAPSLLLGAGYSGGREGIGSFFYHISVLFDVLRDKNSPYVEKTGNGRINILPIIKAGIQIPLFQGGKYYH